MRTGAAVLLAGVFLALLVLGASPARSAPQLAHSVLDVGDSLSVGTAPYLEAHLRGYRIVADRSLGLHASDAASVVWKRAASLQAILVVSAGTNDDPRIVSTFWRAVTQVVTAAGSERCVVWPTIVRPPAVGASYDGLNRALAHVAAQHRNLVLVDWVGLVRRHPEWLAGDGVHVSVEGYRARAAAISAAVTTKCPRAIA